MENKKIYVDGVDVSKCYRYQKKTGYCKGAFKPEELPFCENFDCEFKKLARKTQECEELKKQLMQKSEVDMFFNTPIEGWSSVPCGICKYKNCLTEIKGIAEENIRIADLEGLNGVYRRGLAKQIIQKISEVVE